MWRDNKFNRGPLVSIMVVKALLCLGILMTMVVRLFNVASGVGMVISVVLLFAVIFSKWLRKRFFALRAQFMENLNGESGGRGEVGDMLAASPFADLHLADFVISANSPLVGKTLKEARFRQEYGVNIVAFTRGEERVNIPGGDTVLSAFDKITVVGTDEEIEACRARMSRQESERQRELAARGAEGAHRAVYRGGGLSAGRDDHQGGGFPGPDDVHDHRDRARPGARHEPSRRFRFRGGGRGVGGGGDPFHIAIECGPTSLSVQGRGVRRRGEAAEIFRILTTFVTFFCYLSPRQTKKS